jgi:DNA-binding response OmpR family regulator
MIFGKSRTTRSRFATPILFLTARHQTSDKVIALKLGGDDYVTKPFKAAELLARIEVLLRRVPIRTGHGIHQFGAIRVNRRRAEVTRDDKPLYLSAREFQLLRYLMERAGNTLPRVELLRSVWGYDSGTLTRTVDMHVASLRDKLEEKPQASSANCHCARRRVQVHRIKRSIASGNVQRSGCTFAGSASKQRDPRNHEVGRRLGQPCSETPGG